MWIGVLLSLFIVLLALAYLYGLLSPIRLYQDKMLSPHLLYFPYEGLESGLKHQFDKIVADTKDHFKVSNCFGIYPRNTAEPVWQCVLGVMVNPGEEHKVEQFKEEHPDYREIRLESTRYIGATVPYVSFLSFKALQFKWPQFTQKVKEEGHPDFDGAMEVYHFLSESGQNIELIHPIRNQQQFQLFEK